MREPDVEISASVKADELVIHDTPDVEERAGADPEGESGASTDRRNLPRPVKRNTTYRDVRVSHRLSARLTGADDDSADAEDEDADGSAEPDA
ncbi:hypothetical protein [Actinomadura montaniterrae]|uniref:hypothetical protein n=1 Tax=Actinomadura montaniterrae TaxID=1803903 RepID=UPI00178C31FD|nr:hypothetical protein [Actinomadura montaniterrae]